jgi:hypothetical protein
MVAAVSVISMYDSEKLGVRGMAGIGVVTGSKVAGGVLARASPTKHARGLPYLITHRRRRFALTPCKSAIRATDTPGSVHRRANARLPALLNVRRPFAPGLVIRPFTSSSASSDMVSTTQQVDTILNRSCSPN